MCIILEKHMKSLCEMLSSLAMFTKKFTLQTVQIVMNLIINDNTSSMILENMLSSFEQSAVINSLFIKQMLTSHSHLNNHDNDFSKKIIA